MIKTFPLILQIYGVAIIGFIAVKLKGFSPVSTDGLIKFVFNFSIPSLLFRSLSQMTLPQILPLDLLGAYYLGAFAMFLIGKTFSYYFFHHSAPKQIIFGFGSCFSNTVLLGIPIIVSAFGEPGKYPLFMLISFHGVTLLSTLTVLLEINITENRSIRTAVVESLTGVSKNPIIWGIASGVFVNFVSLGIPDVIDQTLELLARTAVPCALFAFGATLASYKFAGETSASTVIVMLKNVTQPLVVWMLATYVFTIPELWAQVATMLAAMPTGFNIFLFAHRYKHGVDMATTTVFISTLVSMLVVSVLIFLFGL